MKKYLILTLIFFPLISSAQNELWVARYNEPGNDSDVATAIKIDKSNNVYVTGWSKKLDSSYIYITIKYNNIGDTMWVRRYSGSNNAPVIAIDNNNYVYMAGTSYDSITKYDYVLVKYDSNGNIVWDRKYSGLINGKDRITAITIDTNNNVYVTGGSDGSGTDYDYATIKYNSSGDTVWVRRYNGPGNYWDEATAIAVDNTGNVYVTGGDWAPGSSFDYATIKYNSSGDTAWVRRYNGPGNGIENATAIAVDNSGNVYITGFSDGPGEQEDYATIKYDSLGDTMWIRRYDGTLNSLDYAEAIAVDDSENVYVTGEINESITAYDYATIKYNSMGDTVWVRKYNGPGNDFDMATALALDKTGNIYVTGVSYDSSWKTDYATVKYNSSGDTVWARIYNGPGDYWDKATAITVDKSGNAYVTGVSEKDYLTIKYSATGVEENSNTTYPSITLRINQNPFSKSTIIKYQIPAASKVSLAIYDISGSCVKTIVNGEKEAGSYTTILNANDLKTGIYFVKLTSVCHSESAASGEESNMINTTKKLILMK
ncbi:MAG: SBBP repeat-containing protein [bacterium]|nr:SBBP repeat-containing protein [bacterium]